MMKDKAAHAGHIERMDGRTNGQTDGRTNEMKETRETDGTKPRAFEV